MNVRKLIRILSLVLLAAVVFTALPFAALAESATVNAKTYVYKKPDTGSASAKVNKGVKVEVIGVDGKWAMVEKDGKTGFIPAKYLDTASSKEEEKNDAPSFEEYAKPIPAVVNSKTYAYKKADTGSTSMKLKAGVQVDVLAVNGKWAKVDVDGKTAYMYVKYLDKIETAQPEAEEEKEPAMTMAQAFASGKYSNEELCFLYATKTMGYNTAAAAGLLANIKAESSFRVNANGDAGQSYGICQWYASRKTRLLNWCESNGHDPATLLGQLHFLHYELETYYPKVDNYMKSVENSAQGAYDAAYYFCYHFEAPASKESKSVSRGNSAMDSFYPKYA